MSAPSDCEYKALEFIVKFRSENFVCSPTADEIFERLSKVLPKPDHKQPAFVGKLQVFRVIKSRRRKRMLIDPELYPKLAKSHLRTPRRGNPPMSEMVCAAEAGHYSTEEE